MDNSIPETESTTLTPILSSPLSKIDRVASQFIVLPNESSGTREFVIENVEQKGGWLDKFPNIGEWIRFLFLGICIGILFFIFVVKRGFIKIHKFVKSNLEKIIQKRKYKKVGDKISLQIHR